MKQPLNQDIQKEQTYVIVLEKNGVGFHQNCRHKHVDNGMYL